MNHGANVNVVDNDGKIPLHIACEGCEGNVEWVVELLNRGSNVNAVDNSKFTPLHYGCRFNNVTVELLNHGANVNAENKYKCTPLHGACFYGKKEIVVNLLKHGANPYIKDNKGKTAYNTGNKKMRDLIRRTMVEIN